MMKKLIILVMILVLMAMATAVSAGPGGPWYLSDEAGDPVDIPVNCDHPSPDGLDGYWYTNANSGKTHCFNI